MQVPDTTVLSIESLPVSYGDAILVTCYGLHDQRPWRLLVDTGPSKSWPVVQERLRSLPVNDDGRHHVDLLVISHIDHDHIGSASDLLNDTTIECAEVWFNGEPQLPPRRSRREGIALGDQLELGPSVRWNTSFDTAAVMCDHDTSTTTFPGEFAAPNITVLAPNRKAMTALGRAWRKPPKRPATKRSSGDDRGQLAEPATLASRRFVEDRSVPNRSSIVLLVEHRGASVLLMADSVPRIVQPAIRKLTERRGSEAPLHVDVVKLSHHGSRRNTSAKFLDSVRARHYLVSTDGSRHGLPNDEALARVIRNAGTLWFNHDNAVTRRWDADTSPWAGHAYQTQYPTSPTTGAVIHLAGSES